MSQLSTGHGMGQRIAKSLDQQSLHGSSLPQKEAPDARGTADPLHTALARRIGELMAMGQKDPIPPQDQKEIFGW